MECKQQIFKWTKKRLEVAYLLALDKYTIKDIALSIGVSRVAIHSWKKSSEFQEKITEFSKQKNMVKDWERIQHERRITEKIEKSLLERLDELSDPAKISIGSLIKRYFEGMSYLSDILANMPVPERNNQKTLDIRDVIKYCNEKSKETGVSSSTGLQNSNISQ